MVENALSIAHLKKFICAAVETYVRCSGSHSNLSMMRSRRQNGSNDLFENAFRFAL